MRARKSGRAVSGTSVVRCCVLVAIVTQMSMVAVKYGGSEGARLGRMGSLIEAKPGEVDEASSTE